MTNVYTYSGDFQFHDFNGFQNPMIEQPSLSSLPQSQANNFQVPNFSSPPASGTLSPVSPTFDSASTGKKRKIDALDINSQQGIDETSRVAAEEDKRRRNTAASARFRVKKKQREQQLEKTAKEMTERVNVLESKINQLEMENTWLKGLITEKNDKSDLSAMYKEYTKGSDGERSTGQRTDGVGTESKDEKAKA